MLTTTDVAKVYDTILSIPGMNGETEAYNAYTEGSEHAYNWWVSSSLNCVYCR